MSANCHLMVAVVSNPKSKITIENQTGGTAEKTEFGIISKEQIQLTKKRDVLIYPQINLGKYFSGII